MNGYRFEIDERSVWSRVAPPHWTDNMMLASVAILPEHVENVWHHWEKREVNGVRVKDIVPVHCVMTEGDDNKIVSISLRIPRNATHSEVERVAELQRIIDRDFNLES